MSEKTYIRFPLKFDQIIEKYNSLPRISPEAHDLFGAVLRTITSLDAYTCGEDAPAITVPPTYETCFYDCDKACYDAVLARAQECGFKVVEQNIDKSPWRPQPLYVARISYEDLLQKPETDA